MQVSSSVFVSASMSLCRYFQTKDGPRDLCMHHLLSIDREAEKAGRCLKKRNVALLL